MSAFIPLLSVVPLLLITHCLVSSSMTSSADRTVAAAKAELVGMGFSESDSLQAIARTGCNINAAIEWLFNNHAKQQHSQHNTRQVYQKRKASDPVSHAPSNALSDRLPRPSTSDLASSPYLRPSNSHLLNMSSLPLPSLPPASSSPSSVSVSPASDYVYSGVVKRYNAEKAYGFIACPRCPNRKDVFFHQSNALDEQQLSEQDEVEFTLVRKQGEDGSDRYEALNLTVSHYHDPAMEGVRWINKAVRTNRYKQHDGFGLSAPTSPAAPFTSSAPRVGRTDSTAEYLISLPHYGRVEDVGRGGRHAVLVSLPLLPGDEDRYQVDLRSVLPSSWQQLHNGTVVTFMPPAHLSHSPFDIHILPADTFTPLPINHNRANTFQTTLILRHALHCDESRHTEFKSLLANHYLEERTAFLVEKNVNAFLNSAGGWLYVGVDDDGVVDGLWCTKRRRDELKRAIDGVMQHMSPPVDPSLYVLDFLPVHLAVDSELRPGETRLLPLAHVYVLAVSVKAGTSGSVYFTSGRLHEKDESSGKEKAWLRRDGSVREMTQRMVAERMHAINRQSQQDEQQARDRMKEEILRELRRDGTADASQRSNSRPQLTSSERERKYESMDEDRAGDADNEKRIVDLLLTMGVEQAMALQAVHDVYSEGKISARTDGQSLQSVVGQILDKIASAQRRQKHEEKEAMEDDGEVEEQKLPNRRPLASQPYSRDAPSATPQRGGLYPALDNNVSQRLNVPPSPVSLIPSSFASSPASRSPSPYQSTSSSPAPAAFSAPPLPTTQPSLYPTISFAFRSTAAAPLSFPAHSSPSTSSSSHSSPAQRAPTGGLTASSSSFYPAVSSEAADSVPCDGCHASFPFDYYAEHQKVCARPHRPVQPPHQP